MKKLILFFIGLMPAIGWSAVELTPSVLNLSLGAQIGIENVSFYINNDTGNSIKIQSIATSCGCTKVADKFKDTIPSHKKQQIEFAIDASKIKTSTLKTVLIAIEGLSQPFNGTIRLTREISTDSSSLLWTSNEVLSPKSLIIKFNQKLIDDLNSGGFKFKKVSLESSEVAQINSYEIKESSCLLVIKPKRRENALLEVKFEVDNGDTNLTISAFIDTRIEM